MFIFYSKERSPEWDKIFPRNPGANFLQDNARTHMARMSQDCIHKVNTLLWPVRSPDLSPTEHIWDHFGRQVGHSTSLNELEAKLEQI
ncbi:transposable element Tcb2 transposase [Trichonephila clavipes]|nr:transposable element Tcb2 transposase [Trichonephila clavipes]